MNNNEMEFDFLNDNEYQAEKKDHSKAINALLTTIKVLGYILYSFICGFCFLIEALATVFLLSSFKPKKKRRKRWF